jgi:hypothetical protein
VTQRSSLWENICHQDQHFFRDTLGRLDEGVVDQWKRTYSACPPSIVFAGTLFPYNSPCAHRDALATDAVIAFQACGEEGYYDLVPDIELLDRISLFDNLTNEFMPANKSGDILGDHGKSVGHCHRALY